MSERLEIWVESPWSGGDHSVGWGTREEAKDLAAGWLRAHAKGRPWKITGVRRLSASRYARYTPPAFLVTVEESKENPAGKHRFARYDRENPTTEDYLVIGLGAALAVTLGYLIYSQSQNNAQAAEQEPGTAPGIAPSGGAVSAQGTFVNQNQPLPGAVATAPAGTPVTPASPWYGAPPGYSATSLPGPGTTPPLPPTAP